jgi:hypothetical protein
MSCRGSCANHLSHPGILVVKAAEKWNGHDVSNCLYGMTRWSVLLEREMSTSAIAMITVTSENPLEMRFAEDHDVVKAFSPDRADEPFGMSVLPTRAGRGWSVPDTHCLDPFSHDGAGGGVAGHPAQCMLGCEAAGGDPGRTDGEKSFARENRRLAAIVFVDVVEGGPYYNIRLIPSQ